MAKDAYYFSHDSNSQDDPKCMILIDQLGMEGYGIFWGLVEKLRNEESYTLPMSVIGSYAKRWGTSKEKVEAVIKNYGLFIITEDYFFSERLLRSMSKKTQIAKKAANLRWGKTIDNQILDANAYQTHTKRIPNGMQNDAIKVKESKVKESKVKESKVKEVPEKNVFMNFVKERCVFSGLNYEEHEEIASSKYDAWVENGWKDLNGNKIQRWQSKVIANLPFFKRKNIQKKVQVSTSGSYEVPTDFDYNQK